MGVVVQTERPPLPEETREAVGFLGPGGRADWEISFTDSLEWRGQEPRLLGEEEVVGKRGWAPRTLERNRQLGT